MAQSGTRQQPRKEGLGRMALRTFAGIGMNVQGQKLRPALETIGRTSMLVWACGRESTDIHDPMKGREEQ